MSIIFYVLLIDNRREPLTTSTGTLSEKNNTEINRTRPVFKQQLSQTESKVVAPSQSLSTSSSAPTLQEPDVIASTKIGGSMNSCSEPRTLLPASSTEEPLMPAPVAPPRRKKRLKNALQQNASSSSAKSTDSCISTSCKVSFQNYSPVDFLSPFSALLTY